MPNIFAAADAKSSAAVDRFYGEKLRFHPMKTGRYTTDSAADPDRTIRDFVGTLSGELGEQNISGDRSADFRSSIKVRDRTVTVDNAKWPPVEMKVGDQIEALERPGNPKYQISEDPTDDGSGNRTLIAMVSL